jgi:hypothetical protein
MVKGSSSEPLGERMRRKTLTLAGIFVVLIFLLVAAVVIPCLAPLKIAVTENTPVKWIRLIQTAEESYRSSYGAYADSLANLGGAEPCTASAITACLIDQKLARGVWFGYRFVAMGSGRKQGASTTYFIGAAPIVYGSGGRLRFCAMDDRVIRVDQNVTGNTELPTRNDCETFKPLEL